MAGSPRRRPFPYDMIIDGQGVMLGRKDEKGVFPLVGTKVQPFTQAAPSDYSYDIQPPTLERVQPWTDLTLGFGLRKQGSYQDRKYRYAQGVDCSIAGLMIKGPNIITFPPVVRDATVDGRGKFFEIGGSLFLAQGRYILKRITDSSWAVVKDFDTVVAPIASLIYVLDVQVFSSSYNGVKLVWAALNGQKAAYSTDGTTWTLCDGGSGRPDHTSLAYCQVDNEFWRASDVNAVSKVDVDADPTVGSNWSPGNSFRVGDKSSPIVSMVVTATGALMIFKTDGVYTLDAAGDAHRLFTSLAEGIGGDTENGRYYGSFGDSTHFTYGHQHLRVAPSISFGTSHLELEAIGPEKFTENDSPVRGRITAFQGSSAQGAYAAIYNDDTRASYLLKFGAWLTPVMSGGKLEEAARIDAWHGALDAPDLAGNPLFANKKITQMTRSPIGATARHYRIYGACSDGTMFWFQVPCVPNPLGCIDYQYTTLDAYLYLPHWTGTFEVDIKSLFAVSVVSTKLSTTNSIRFDYKIDPSQISYGTLGTQFVRPIRQRESFPNNTGVYLADFRVAFVSTAANSTPEVTAVTLHHAVRPLLILTYEFTVLCSDGLVTRAGAPVRRAGADRIREVIKGAAGAIGSVTVILPDESQQELTFVDYKESISFDERLRQWKGSLDCVAVQYTSNTTYGTWARVGQYRWQDIGAYSWQQLTGL